MARFDFRKQQLSLLKAEKLLAASAAAVVAAPGIAQADEVTDGAFSAAQADLAQAYIALAETTSAIHSMLEAKVAAAGGRLLADGGGPKLTVAEMVRSALGLG